MAEKMTPAAGWGPERKGAALSLTFDNFGEAAAIEVGAWGDQPVGQHYTADFVPELLDTLGDVRATYFVEASNCELYPDALRRWSDAGQEIGVHGWRHEAWDRCPAARRRDILARSLEAMHGIGVEPTGFRPPGGEIPAECWGELQDAGFFYCSDLGSPGVGRVGDMVAIQFEWRGVDAFFLEDVLAPVRTRYGYPQAALDIQAWRAELKRAVDETVAKGGHRTIVFHPLFLAESGAKLDVVQSLIAMARDADMWIAPLGDVAVFSAAQLGLKAMEPA